MTMKLLPVATRDARLRGPRLSLWHAPVHVGFARMLVATHHVLHSKFNPQWNSRVVFVGPCTSESSVPASEMLLLNGILSLFQLKH